MKKQIIFIIGVILLIGIFVTAKTINDSIDLDKIKKDKLKDIGITSPTITPCIKIDDYTCKAKVYEKGGINKEIKIKTGYCDTYILEETNGNCSIYEDITEYQCSNQLVYEDVCKEVEKETCSWIQSELGWIYECINYNETICEDSVKQFCMPYLENQCTYEDVFIENCTFIDDENRTECNNILQPYKEKVCKDIEIKNCTNAYEYICEDVVTGQNCTKYNIELVKTNECDVWIDFTKLELETKIKDKTESILNNIADIQLSRNETNNILTDEIIIDLKEKMKS